MEIREGVKLLLAEFREMLMRNDARYLKFASHAVHAAPHLDLKPVQKILGELVLQYLMHQPELMRMQNIPVMSYIVINGGMFAMIRHLGESAPTMTFEQLSDGLADMVDHVVAGELRKADQNRCGNTGAN